MAILLNWCTLPIGVALERVCTCSLNSRLLYKTTYTEEVNHNNNNMVRLGFHLQI